MAHVSNLAKALAAAANDVVAADKSTPVFDAVPAGKFAGAPFTPPDSTSPDLPANVHPVGSSTPPPMDIDREVDMQDPSEDQVGGGRENDDALQPAEEPAGGMPLSKGALSGLDASAAITPAMLAKDYLPGIMLNNGPRPIRFMIGELTHSVPGFSRIAPNKARRLVVAALENRNGGGPDGSVAFFKTGWGRWDAHVIGAGGKDSGIGSFNDGHLSPPRSELSSYAISHGDSGVHMSRSRIPSGWRDQHSGGSRTASSLREEDEEAYQEDMDMLEHEADKMSLDGVSDSGSTTNDDTDDEDDWAAASPAALRKASLPTPGAPRWHYKAYTIPKRRFSRDWSSRRPSAISHGIPPPQPSSSLPHGNYQAASSGSKQLPLPSSTAPAAATPEEEAAIAALLSLGASV